MPKVKDLIFKYDNNLKDGADIEKEKSKKKFKEILEKFKSGNVSSNIKNKYERPIIVHDETFNNKLDFWKNKEKEVIEETVNIETDEEIIEKTIKKKKKDKKEKKNKMIKNNSEESNRKQKVEDNIEDIIKEKKTSKKKKDKKEKGRKKDDLEENLEDEFEKMLKDL